MYHLPRVMYWLENKSVFQIIQYTNHDYMGPFGEYILLHLYGMFGSDRFVFFSQWLSYILIPLTAIALLQRLRISQSKIDAVVILLLTLPMAVVQSVTTQADLIAGFFVILSLYFAFLWRQTQKTQDLFFLAISMGLAMLTKQSSVIFFMPTLCIVCLTLWTKRVHWLERLIFLGGVVCLIYLPFAVQFYALYGTFLPSQTAAGSGGHYTNEIFSLGQIVSNLLRNILIHIPFPFFQKNILTGIENIHQIMRISMNDPRTTWVRTQFQLFPVLYPHEDLVGAPIHIVFLFLSFIALCLGRIKEKKDGALLAGACVVGSILSFMLFSMVFKWQPWNSRLHLPMFLIASIGIGMVLPFRHWFARMILFVSIVLTVAIICFNVQRPYISYTLFHNKLGIFQSPLARVPQSIFTLLRQQQYFNSAIYWYEPYKKITESLSTAPPGATVAFQFIDGFEYPFWILLKDQNQTIHIVRDTKNSDYVVESVIAVNKQEMDQDTCEPTIPAYGYVCLREGKGEIKIQ